MNNCEAFLVKHGIPLSDNFANYHYSYALYAFYMIDAMRQAQEIEEGLYFEENYVASLLENLRQAQETMRYYRNKLNIPYPEFDIAEKITLKGCRLEEGMLAGNCEEAVKTARMWIKDYFDERSSLFPFEVGVYILLLLQEEVDYSFLIRGRA